MTVKPAASSPVREIAFVAFDTETTGMDFTTDRLVDLGAARFRVASIDSTFDSLVNPRMPIPADSMAIHHITDEMAAQAPSARSVLERFLPVLDGAILVGHNAPFDMAILSIELKRAGLPIPDLLVLDSCVLAERVLGDEPTLKLDALMLKIGASERNTHRALPDARCAVRLFQHCCEKIEKTEGHLTWGDVIAAHGPAFSLSDFSKLAAKDMWHYAVAVNAIEERRAVDVSLRDGSKSRDVEIRPHRFDVRDGRWCVLSRSANQASVVMDQVLKMSKRF